jgi:hypothetical protein
MKNPAIERSSLGFIGCQAKIFVLRSKASNDLLRRRSLSVDAESPAPDSRVSLLGWVAAQQWVAQNFVDIMVEIHNKIRNIKSLKSDKGAVGPLSRKSRKRDCFSSWVSQGY